ncbi:MAG: threonine synthase, partial [archaeon GB-1845-036]|nr:threonine synthase [Candidatus Culexmicrobium thermophilum]
MAGKILSLKCVNCGEIYKPDENLNFCKRCGSILEFQLNYDHISSKLSKDRLKLRDFNMWRYWELIPIEDKSYIISLGEGGTPLIKSRR